MDANITNTTIQNMVVDSLNKAATNTIDATTVILPGLIAAIVIFVLGWAAAVIVSKIFEKILRLIKIEKFLERHKLEDALGSIRLSDVLVAIVKYYLILIFLQAALSFLSLGTITTFMNSLLLYVPVITGAILIVLATVLLGEYVKEKIIELGESSGIVRLSARVVKLLIVYMGITMGLSTAGFDTTIITMAFVTILQAVVYGVALAVGIAFGLGGQEDAKDMIKGIRENLDL